MVARYEEGEHALVEAYRSMRTAIMVNKNLKTILVTSSEMNEGKTTTVSNLAKCFSDLEDKKILLIDCDLRKPSINRHFNLDNEKGLTNYINEEIEFEEVIKTVDKLDILTTGTRIKNPSELLESEKMMDFIEGFKYKYDYIFIDSPPVSRVNDACIMAKYIDGTAIVSASNEVDAELAKTTKKRLQKVNTNVIGIILNKFRSENDIYYNYYDYYDEYKKPSKFKSLFKKKRRR
ncbi:MAG: CpsD/CapB family tyrosine-protein kinase [Paraclostridium sp.]